MTRHATPQHLLLQLEFLSAVNTWTTAEHNDWREKETENQLNVSHTDKKREKKLV